MHGDCENQGTTNRTLSISFLSDNVILYETTTRVRHRGIRRLLFSSALNAVLLFIPTLLLFIAWTVQYKMDRQV